MRYPAVAGTFYPSSESQLRKMLESFVSEAKGSIKPKERISIVAPHAGYVYSGSCAAYAYAACSNWSKKSLTVVVVGPNHTGMGLPVAVSLEDWQTPLGKIECDKELASAIISSRKVAQHDEQAHFYEHSCEVQLPFIQFFLPSARLVSICMGFQDLASAQSLAAAVFEAAVKTKRQILLVASSDFTHYEPAPQAEKKDRQAIDYILKLDEAGFQNLVEEKGLSICGHGPIATAIAYSKLAGAKECQLLKYTNSGYTSMDFESVVAYASLAFSK
ncbi:MAG: AmmeMemoRadiSam system protein B [Candidatus Micrarchaeota archaeon]|nr:AmmeMemoRadiSam system protein B [Candidatus Micrarchaeota archaeon]